MKKKVLPLSFIIALRFLGLFIVLPVLSVYALSLEGANEILVGVVIGGYALTQVIFQVPFGMVSDKFGRKNTIIFGLIIFILGSIVCALSNDIYSLMFGRFLQGAGAIGAVVTAMISDVVKEEVRAKAMAMMGGSIAGAFAIAMMVGPIMGAKYGVASLFWLTAILSLLAIIILVTLVPQAPKIIHSYTEDESKISVVLKDKNLMKMNITNLLQKGMMTLAFLIIPIIMIKTYGYDKTDLWKVYLPAMILGVMAMAPAAIIGEKKNKSKEMLMVGVALFAVSYLVMGFTSSDVGFIVGVIIFFVGFNMHEPLLQSMASKYAKIHQKGAALGVFNSFGYFGTFLGGLIGGIFLQSSSLSTIAITITVISIGWIFLIYSLDNLRKFKNLYLNFADIDREKSVNLRGLDGVVEWYFNESEKVLVVKYKNEVTNEEQILNSMR